MRQILTRSNKLNIYNSYPLVFYCSNKFLSQVFFVKLYLTPIATI